MKYNQDINRCRGVDPRLLGQMLGYDTPICTPYGSEQEGGTCTKPQRNCRSQNAAQNRMETNNSHALDFACGTTPSLAMVYSPHQFFTNIFSAEEALKHGTLFCELYKPWMPGGGCR